MIRRAFHLLSTTATAAFIFWVALLHIGLTPDAAAVVAAVGGVLVTSIGELQ